MKEQIYTCDDDTIILLLTQGNKDAWEYVYDKYSMSLYGKLLKMTSSKEMAEEILIHVFMGYEKNVVHLKKRATLFITLFNYTHETALQFIDPKVDKVKDAEERGAFSTINKMFFDSSSRNNKDAFHSHEKADIGKQLRIELNYFRKSMPSGLFP